MLDPAGLHSLYEHFRLGAGLDSSSSSLRDEKANPINMAVELHDVEKNTPAAAEWKPQKHEYLVMITLATVSLMVALDATILVSVLPTLATSLHGTANEALWTATSYLLTSAVFQPFIAALSDIFGRRELLFPSIVLFTIGSVLCALSHTFTQLLVGRCIQGIGGGGIITLSQVIFADIIPLRQRPKYFSLVLLAWAVGSVLGPLVGGVFVQKSTWRWCFWINLPLCAMGLVMTLLFVRLETERTSLRQKLLRVDWWGGVLFISGLTSFLIAISWGGVQFPWSSYQTLVPLLLGLLAISLSFVWEVYGAREPFLRHSLFKKTSSRAAYICALLQGLMLFCSLYYIPFFFTSVHTFTPIRSGLSVFPATVLLLPGSAIVSALITRIGHFRIFIWSGWTFSAIGAGLLILWSRTTPTPVWATGECFFGLGMGMALSSINFGIQALCDMADAGRASAMYAFCRSLGMAVGVAVGGSVFQNLLASHLKELGLPVEISKNAEGYVAILHNLPDSDPYKIAVLDSYVHGFKGVFIVMTALCAAALAISAAIRHESLDRDLKSQYRLSRQGLMTTSGRITPEVVRPVSVEGTGTEESVRSSREGQ